MLFSEGGSRACKILTQTAEASMEVFVVLCSGKYHASVADGSLDVFTVTVNTIAIRRGAYVSRSSAPSARAILPCGREPSALRQVHGLSKFNVNDACMRACMHALRSHTSVKAQAPRAV